MLVAIMLIQLIVTIVVGVYFFGQLRRQGRETGCARTRGSSARELEHLAQLRRTQLSRPLGEQVRPKDFSDIIGQQAEGDTLLPQPSARNHIRPARHRQDLRGATGTGGRQAHARLAVQTQRAVYRGGCDLRAV